MATTLKLTLEYDGTRYHGWQSQKNSRAVQDALIEAAREVLATDVEIGGAGRTDAGVHALAQVAHLKFRISDSKSKTDLDSLRIKLNQSLPTDISIIRIEPAPAGFHARHDALRRYYLYQIARRKTSFSKRFVWWVKGPLNLKRMERAAELIVGKHDFAAFGDSRGEKKSTLVEMYECSLLCANDLILVRMGASHFLWKMVRRLVGSMVEVGLEDLTVEEFGKILEQRKRSAAEWTAPASGLFLEKVTYAEDEGRGELKPVLWV
ncbi:MAG TPA: tRNA pseudouridine(38-40) synthase TruA [Acidobacteriota bacterium]|jgi:tRNA pseudouridine38-40 synthase